MLTSALLALGGLLVPPVADFVKKKFLPASKDTVEATANSLALSNPAALPGFLTSSADLLKQRIGWFNRDVIGTPSQWVVDLRACIRPLAVVLGFLLLGCELFGSLNLDPATRNAIIMNNSSWFGSRLK